MSREVDISYLKGQGELLECTARHILFCAGVGSGKTEGGARWCLKRLLAEPWAVGFIGAQTHDQLTKVSLPPFLRILTECGFRYVYNRAPPEDWGPSRFPEHDHVISILVPGAVRPCQVFTGTMGNYEAHRGKAFGWYWLDESRDMEEGAFDVVLSRLRGQHLWEPPGCQTTYGGLNTTTPNGYGFLYKRFVAEPVPGSAIIRARTTDNPYLTPDFIADLRAQYTERFARQELDGEFLNLTSGQAYYGFRRDRHVVKVPLDPLQPMFYTADFNVSPLCAVYGQNDKRTVRVTGEIFLQGSGRTADAVEEFCRRHVKHLHRHITVYGDQSGANRDTRSGTTDYAIIEEVLKAHGWSVLVRRNYQNPSLVESIEAVNARLEHGGILIDHSAKRTVTDLEQVAWEEGTRILDKSNPGLTHCSDALRYMVAMEYPLPIRKAGWAPGSLVRL